MHKEVPGLLCLGLATANEPLAQASYPEPVKEWDNDWTVLTMAPDGSWGVASHDWVIEALSRAIGNCRKMSRHEIGCGAIFTTIRAGWSLGYRCGDKNIVMAEARLEDAEVRADWREYELRQLYDPDMPPCVRIVTVDPHGRVVPPDLWYSDRIFSSP